mmetsp:Transcript_36890/g.78270  ORF Transcript_36890/g.78270 Transcript_36890/m.78270 type:complete len:122 (-) Transcript_36890:2-367(-)
MSERRGEAICPANRCVRPLPNPKNTVKSIPSDRPAHLWNEPKPTAVIEKRPLEGLLGIPLDNPLGNPLENPLENRLNQDLGNSLESDYSSPEISKASRSSRASHTKMLQTRSLPEYKATCC